MELSKTKCSGLGWGGVLSIAALLLVTWPARAGADEVTTKGQTLKGKVTAVTAKTLA